MASTPAPVGPVTSSDFYLDWNSDLVLTPSGSIQTAIGWDRIRQRIIRRAITNPAQLLPSGRATPADYVFHQKYGLGMGALVDNPFSPGLLLKLESKISAAALVDDDIDSAVPPSVTFYQPPSNNALWTVISVTLKTGQPGVIGIPLGGH